MERWQEKHILENLSDLIKLTNCSSELLSRLTNILSLQDRDTVKSKKTPQDQAEELFVTAMKRNDGYYSVASALQGCKQTGALKIILNGYKVNSMAIPEGLEDISASTQDPEAEVPRTFNDMVMGDPDCTESEVAAVIKASQKFTEFDKKWKPVAKYLEIRGHKITKLSLDYCNRKVKTPQQLLDTLLSIWKDEKEGQAKVKNLSDAFKANDLSDVAKALSSKFGKKEVTQVVKFVWQGKERTLEELLGENVPEATLKMIKDELGKRYYNKPIGILKEYLIPERPGFYIKRTLSHMSELDPAIFKSDYAKGHFFLFEGKELPTASCARNLKDLVMDKYDCNTSDVVTAVQNSPSFAVLHDKWTSVARHLEIPEHKIKHLAEEYLLKIRIRSLVQLFDELLSLWKAEKGDQAKISNLCNAFVNCGLADVAEEVEDMVHAKPLHLIHHENKRYWLKSSNSLELIRSFLKCTPQKCCEKEMAQRITSLSPPCSFSIADSPGMGKTLVLENLARRIQQVQDAIVLFIVLQEFVQKKYFVNSYSSALKAIADYSSCDHITGMIVFEILKTTTQQIYLLLDGYDEVVQDEMDRVDEFLKTLNGQKNVKVIVTSRPHLQTRLEDIFSAISYQILPFDEPNLIDFLVSFWIDQYEVKEFDVVKAFARQCLNALATNLTDVERKIAEIPLQCWMLAEVYAHEAKEVSKRGILSSDRLQPISFFQMYQNLIDYKFGRIEGLQVPRLHYMHAHVYDAIALLFPDCIEIFEPLLKGREKIEENFLYSIGLIVKSPNANTRRFIHRTFAEYLLAEFIVKNMDKRLEYLDLLFGEILGRKGTIRNTRKNGGIDLDLKYPVIVNFIEMHLCNYTKTDLSDEQEPSQSPYGLYATSFNPEDVALAIVACCKKDLKHTFNYAATLQKRCRIGEEIKLRRIPLMNIIRILGNFDVKILDWLHSVGEDINFQDRNGDSILFYALEFSDNAYFIKKLLQYGANAKHKNMKRQNSLHKVVGGKASTKTKLLIIDALVEVSHDLLEERDENDCTPLLLPKMHLSILQRLVQLGADVNAFSRVHGTVLSSGDKDTYMERARWALTNGFKLVNHKDECGRTVLMKAIEEIGTLDNELLKLFHKVGANYNVDDLDGNSVLFYALEYSEDFHFIKTLIENGANVNHANKKRQTALHKVMKRGNSTEDKLEIIDFLVDSNRGLLEEKDEHGCSPLLQYNADLNLLSRLVELGADINAKSSGFGTILHSTNYRNTYVDRVRWAFSNGFKLVNQPNGMHAIKEFGAVDDEVLQMFYKAGADFNYIDVNGNSVLFLALECSKNVEFIGKLLDYGADVNYINKEQKSATDIVILHHKDDMHLFRVLKFLNSKGFNQFNVTDVSRVVGQGSE